MFQSGVARTRLTPPWGVELAGWGYYLNRIWRRVRDHTAATAARLRRRRALRRRRRRRSHVRSTPNSPRAVRREAARHTPHSAGGDLRRLLAQPQHADGGIRSAGPARSIPNTRPGPPGRRRRPWYWRGSSGEPAALRVGKAEVVGWTVNRTRDERAGRYAVERLARGRRRRPAVGRGGQLPGPSRRDDGPGRRRPEPRLAGTGHGYCGGGYSGS